MEIKIRSLSLNNFKGISTFDFMPEGKSISVYGTNASGKTTLADAYFWLLFGKDSSGAAVFDVKTVGTSGLDYGVTAEIEIDGKKHILSRTLNEKWERKHGETVKRLKGNTTTYMIDSVPVKEKEYKAFIENEIIPEKTYQMLTDPDFFAGKTDWKKRRTQLLEWFADISDEDIISNNSSLSELGTILGGRTVENARKAIQANRKIINELLKAIPNRIDEQQRNINEINAKVSGDEEVQLDSLINEKKLLEEQFQKLSSDEELTKAKAEVENVKLEILKARKVYEESCMKDNTAEKKILALRKEKLKLQGETADNIQTTKSLKKRLEGITAKGKSYNEEFQRISVQEYEESSICPCCGQPLPKEKIQAAVKEFNFRKSKQLEDIRNACAVLKSERIRLKSSILEHEERDTELCKQIDQVDTEIEKLTASIEKPVPFEKTEEYEKLSMKLIDAEENVDVEEIRFNENTAKKSADLKTKLRENDARCSEFRNRIAEQKTVIMYQKRIDELMEQEKEYGMQLAKTDMELTLIDEFIKVKCTEVENRINSHFSLVKWKLFDMQVNGGINDCCEATVNGVDYSTNLNSASKLNAGLDIINTISEVTDTFVPIWIDNAESVVDQIKTKAQTIRLVVSSEHKKLTVKE